MEQRIKKLFTEDILVLSKTLYPMDQDSLKLLGGFEAFVYEYTYQGQGYILKIAHSSHRTQAQIESELDFVRYLYEQGGRVSKPILNRHGIYTHMYPVDSGYFVLSSTEKATGKRPVDLLTNPILQFHYGQTIGHFHQLTQDYRRPEHIEPRFAWDQDPLILEIKQYLDDNDAYIYEALQQTIHEIRQIPKTTHNYGLIHTDIHRSNFLVDAQNQLTVFDFDDASEHYVISDLAIAIFYSLFFDPDRHQKAPAFILQLLKGYTSRYPIYKSDFLTLERFFRLRILILYIALKRSTDPKDPFTAKYNEIYVPLIQSNTPFLELDYIALYEQLP